MYKLAGASALAGAVDEAIEVLELMVGPPFIRTIVFIRSDPLAASLSSHPQVMAWLDELRELVERDRVAFDKENP